MARSDGANAYDIAIIGGGIAGAGLAYMLGQERRVVLLEQESGLGSHTTGRSAALYTQAYGNSVIRALTTASKPFYDTPPTGFADYPLLTNRGVLLVGRADQRQLVENEVIAAQRLAPRVRLVERDEAISLSPALKPDYVDAACYEPDAKDMDVDAIMQGFVRGARANGTDIRLEAGVLDLTEKNSGWRIETQSGEVDAEIVVNASGAWATHIAQRAGATPHRVTPKRRTACLVEAPPIPTFAASAATIDVQEEFYFKPDAGLALISPADETPVEAHDAYPEEMDIAVAVDRVQRAANIPIRSIAHSRAGLRCFADDKTPIAGFDDRAPGFFWLAGQGGYGIQTAPALSMLAAAQILGHALPDSLLECGVDQSFLSPERFLD